MPEGGRGGRVRILAHGASLRRAGSRVPAALAGLDGRGHEVHWLGSDLPLPEGHGVRVAAGMRGLAGVRAEVVVGGGESPVRAALVGWLVGARVMVLDLTHAGVGRWRSLERAAWHSLFSSGLVEAGEVEPFAADPHGLERERIGIWPAVPAGRLRDPAHPDTEVLERACERSLARHQARAARAAVFLDRDGTLIRETGYLSDPETVELLPGVGRALRNLVEAGYPLVVVSNQSGIARGMFSEARVHAVMARLRERLRAHGVELAAVYFCPHHPEAGCACRKPRPGLLERAADDLDLALKQSVMIGDKRIDAATGRNAGGRGILVRSGYGRAEAEGVAGEGPPPDRVCDDLAAAVDWWLGPT